MSDPRIYHRVGPNAPEGRQIYDDMRRRDRTLTSNFDSELSTVNTLLNNEIIALDTTLSGEITAIETNITDIETAATALDLQVNSLVITPVQVGTGTGFALETLISNTGDGTTVSSIVVTPVVAKPFFLVVAGGLFLEAGVAANDFYANIYEGSSWLQNPYSGSSTTAIPVGGNGWAVFAGQGGAPIGLGAHILIPNTSTSTRSFKLAVRSQFTPAVRTAQHAGTFNAFQWTVA